MMHAIVYGPLGCGKTHNAERIAKYLGCTNVIDDACSLMSPQGLETPTLFLTSDANFSVPNATRHWFKELIKAMEQGPKICDLPMDQQTPILRDRMDGGGGKNTGRDLRIYAAYMTGTPANDIAEATKLSPERVKQIVAKVKRIASRRIIRQSPPAEAQR